MVPAVVIFVVVGVVVATLLAVRSACRRMKKALPVASPAIRELDMYFILNVECPGDHCGAFKFAAKASDIHNVDVCPLCGRHETAHKVYGCRAGSATEALQTYSKCIEHLMLNGSRLRDLIAKLDGDLEGIQDELDALESDVTVWQPRPEEDFDTFGSGADI